MATRIVPIAEVTERLGSLDMANPSFRETEAEQHFLQFFSSIRASKPTAPSIVWLSGIYDTRNRLLDMGISPDNTPWYQGPRNAISNYHNGIVRALHNLPFSSEYLTVLNNISPVSAVSAGLAEYWRVNQMILCDENFLQAFEAGLGFFLFRQNTIVLIPRPGILLRQEVMPQHGQTRAATQRVLHSLRSPAVNFPQDPASNQFWIRGVRVPRFVVETPERITRAHILAARTRDLRQTLIDQYGLLRYSLERGFKQVDHNEKFGATLYVKGGNRGRYGNITIRECVVDLINSTPEPDGTQRHFARRVPSTMRNAHQAVAWTFGFDRASDYHPDAQT